MGARRLLIPIALALAALGAAGPARAADPGRWTETATTTLPLVYFQGVTADPRRNLYFDGVFVGLYRTTEGFTETGRNDDVIPPDVHLRERYNHVGDISWDAREGGRVLLPLECYYPGGPADPNPCRHGSIGVADPATLRWRYYVKLDPAEIPKAMWNEVSPDGELVWTSSGDDLLAYRTADVSLANAAPGAAPIRAARRLRGAVPPSGITGGTFVGRRLFVAGQGGGPFRVWSIDLATGARRLEIERRISGESEGLLTLGLKGGRLHWLIQPFDPQGRPPTYARDKATLVSFGPAPSARLVRRTRAGVLRRGGFTAALRCPGSCAARLRVVAGRRVLARGTRRVRGSARRLVRLTPRGRRVLATAPRGLRVTLRATLRGPTGTLTRRTARMRLR